MIDHLSLGVSDLGRSGAFYDAGLADEGPEAPVGQALPPEVLDPFTRRLLDVRPPGFRLLYAPLGAEPRDLLDLGAEPYLVASGVQVVLAQRLVRKLCPACKKPVALCEAGADENAQGWLVCSGCGLRRKKLTADPPDGWWAKPAGQLGVKGWRCGRPATCTPRD
jgi:hypothetical protein